MGVWGRGGRDEDPYEKRIREVRERAEREFQERLESQRRIDEARQRAEIDRRIREASRRELERDIYDGLMRARAQADQRAFEQAEALRQARNQPRR